MLVVVGLCCTILTISSCSSTVCIDLRSDDTCTLGSVPHSRNAQNTLVKTARFGVLHNGYLLRYSSTAAFALPLQYPYTQTMSAYSSCVNVRGILTNRSVTRHSQLNPTVHFKQYCNLPQHQPVARRIPTPPSPYSSSVEIRKLDCGRVSWQK